MVEIILHTTPKKKVLALTQGDCLQGNEVIYFSNLCAFKFLSSLAISLQVIFSGPNSYQFFNLSRALCNCMYRLWVSFSHFIIGLFMLRNLWGITRGLQPEKCECRKELSQRKISAKYSCIYIWRLLVTSIFWLCLYFQNIKGSTWKGNVQTKLLNINKLDT